MLSTSAPLNRRRLLRLGTLGLAGLNLPRVLWADDSAIGSLLDDLVERGLFERTLVVVMGEFGRTPKISAVNITKGRVIPADIAATVYRHLEIDLGARWTDLQGRPHPIVADGGRPIAGLS